MRYGKTLFSSYIYIKIIFWMCGQEKYEIISYKWYHLDIRLSFKDTLKRISKFVFFTKIRRHTWSDTPQIIFHRQFGTKAITRINVEFLSIRSLATPWRVLLKNMYFEIPLPRPQTVKYNFLRMKTLAFLVSVLCVQIKQKLILITLLPWLLMTLLFQIENQYMIML